MTAKGLRVSCVRIESGTYRGTGFFVFPRGHILTCAHVILDQTDIRITAANPEGEFDLPLDVKVFHAPVNEDCDLALIEVSGELPFHLQPLEMRLAESYFSNANPGAKRFQTYGFTAANTRHGEPADGEIIGLSQDDNNTPQIKLAKTSGIDAGFSGGPIVDEATGYVIGINVERVERGSERIHFAFQSEFISANFGQYGLKSIPYQPALVGIRTVSSRRIQYKDLDDRRDSLIDDAKRDYYFHRSIDDRLLYDLQNPAIRLLLVVGDPLAGKTRAVINALQKLEEHLVYLPQRDAIERLGRPSLVSNSVVIFNDINEFCNTNQRADALNDFLQHCFSNNIKVVATCRTGGEYLILQNALSDRFGDLMNDALEIDRLNQFELNRIKLEITQLGIHLDLDAYQRCDRNIGSLFLHITAMRRRYQTLAKDDLAKIILRTLKALYVSCNWEEDRTFHKTKVKKYTDLKTGGRFFKDQFSAAFELLSDSRTGQSFILEQANEAIFIEEAYLKYAIQDENEHYEREIKELIPRKDDKVELGFFPVFYWNKKIHEVPDFITAETGLPILYKMYANGRMPDATIFNSLIVRSADYELAKAWFREMVDLGVQSTRLIFFSLIEKSDTPEQVEQWHDVMIASKLDLNTDMYNRLIFKSKDYLAAKNWYQKIILAGFKPDIITFNHLILKSQKPKDALYWADKMRDFGWKPDAYTYSFVIAKANNYTTAFEWYEQMISNGIRPELSNITIMISLSPDQVTAQKWFKECERNGLSANVYQWTSLIDKIEDENTAIQIFEKMQNEGIRPNDATFNTLINKAKDEKKRIVWLERMAELGISPDVITFTTLITKAEGNDLKKRWFKSMYERGIIPDTVLFNSLINKAEDAELACFWFDQMMNAGIKPNEVTFTSLINKAEDTELTKFWFDQMTFAGIIPDEVTFNSLINKAGDTELARFWFGQMMSAGRQPNIYTISSLLKWLGRDCEDIIWVEREREKFNIQINDVYARQLETARKRHRCPKIKT